MSRSQPALTNPATHFMEWKGGNGELSYWDKEKKEKVLVKLPLEFLVLDQLSTITGYSKRDKNSYYSNEVRNVTKDELTVKVAGTVREHGLYKDLTDVRAKGASYTKSVYIAYKVGEDYTIGNIKMNGSALSSWIEFTGTCIVDNGKVTIERGKKQESSVGDFYPPQFTWSHSSPDEDKIAVNLDKILQVYLSQYLINSSEPEEISDEVNRDIHTTTDDRADLPKDAADAYKKWDSKNNEDAEAQSLYNSYAGQEEIEP